MLLYRLVLTAMMSLFLLVPGTAGFTQNGTAVNDSVGAHMGPTDGGLNAAAVVFGEISPAVVKILVLSVESKRFSHSEASVAGLGSLINFDGKDGLVLTCEHVIRDHEKQIYVLLSDRRVYRALVLARDAAMDTAVLKLVLDLQIDTSKDNFRDGVFRYFENKEVHQSEIL